MNNFINSLLSHFLGSNWQTELVNEYLPVAGAYFAANGQTDKAAVQTWVQSHFDTLTASLSTGNPLVSYLIKFVAASLVPQITTQVYNYLVEHVFGSTEGKSLEGSDTIPTTGLGFTAGTV